MADTKKVFSGPRRILERARAGQSARGRLVAVVARAGVGKTAFLVQVGLELLLNGRRVLHVALGRSIEAIEARYHASLTELVERALVDAADADPRELGRRRWIQVFADHQLGAERLGQTLALARDHLSLTPDAILVDGWEWTGDHAARAAELELLKALAREADAELWIGARSLPGEEGAAGLPAPCHAFAAQIDAALVLAAQGDHIEATLVHDQGQPPADVVRLELEPGSLAIPSGVPGAPVVRLPAAGYTLLSGGASGSEAAFGRTAEEWGMHEINYSFRGREVVRQRGLTMLSDSELGQGDVSMLYVTRHMHRTYPDSPDFRKVLQTIWHQVSTAGEVFVIGVIQPDGTVRGGTGWAAELGRHWKKPVHVFDQDREAWFTWNGREWERREEMKIAYARFCGTGSRELRASGKQAIRELFERTFGPAPDKA